LGPSTTRRNDKKTQRIEQFLPANRRIQAAQQRTITDEDDEDMLLTNPFLLVVLVNRITETTRKTTTCKQI